MEFDHRRRDLSLALLWGTHSVVAQDIETYDEMVDRARAHAVQEGFAKENERIVIIAGIPFAKQGTTNNIRVARA